MGRYWNLLPLLGICSIAFLNVSKCEPQCQLDKDVINNIASYSDDVDKIIKLFTKGEFKGKTYQSLEDFVDLFGNRIAGSQNLENAIDYMLNKSSEENLDNVHGEDVDVDYWIRGKEYVKMYYPRYKKLPMLGLGFSVATPLKGITAEAIVVRSFDELNSLPDEEVQGKIVVYDEPYVSYGQTVAYRSRGASAAAKKGAKAALVRSITPFSIASPHTGMQSYDPNAPQIPVAAITHEDADMLWRLQQKGHNITLKMKMSAKTVKAVSRNTIAELQGSQNKDDVILVSGHLDSWDVGDGAMDDGGGSFVSWIAPIALKKLNLRPKRTIRVVLWTGEEYGYVGSTAYAKQHLSETPKLKFVMESDIGIFKPRGLTYGGSDKGYCMVKEIIKLFSSINATEVNFSKNDVSSDIDQWVQQGIPGAEVLSENEKYFWFHHSEGDRINVLDSDSMDKCAAMWTAFAYIVADMKYEVPRRIPNEILN